MKRIYRKRLISFAVMLSMLLSCMAGGAVAKADAKVWGDGGEPLNWYAGGDPSIKISIDGDTLTVTGTGAMGDYSSAASQVYKDDAGNVTTINVQSGITAIGNNNFNTNFTSLTTVTLAETVTKIGNVTFSACTQATIDIKGQLTELGANPFGTGSTTAVKKIIVHDAASYDLVNSKKKSATVLELAGGTDELKNDLQEYVNEIKAQYPEADYTVDSYAKLKEALEKADEVLANPSATAGEITQAKKDIEQILLISKPVSYVDAAKKELNTVISNAEKMSTGGYTKSSVAALEAAIAAAKEAYKNATTVDQVQQAKTALEEAMEVDETGLADKGLKRNADLEHSQALNVAVNNSYSVKKELYTEDSYARYQAVVDKMKEMQTNGCTNEQVDAVLAELEEAEAKLVRDENYTVEYEEYKNAKAAVLKILNEEDSPYTKKSLDSVKSVYDYQTSMIETDGKYRDDRVQSDVDDVTKTLKNVIDPASDSYRLVEKGDTTELAALVASAKELDESKYTLASWLDLSDALAVAEPLVADPDNAAKADVEAAVKAMKDAMAGLVEKSQNPGDTTTPGGDGDGSTTNPGGNGDGSTTNPGGDGDGSTTTPGGDGNGGTTNPDGDGDGSTTNPGGNGNGGTTQPTKKPDSTKKVTVKKVSVKKASSPKKKTLKVTWKKVSGVTGYQIQISTDKKFKKGVKKYTVKKAKTTNKTIKKLKSKKTYYVRICAYKTVSGKKYYGDWSKAKKAKVK